MRMLSPFCIFHFGLAVFLIFGMVIDHSYSVGAVIMLITSIYTVIKYRRDIEFKKNKVFPLIWALYALVCILVVIIGGHTSRDFEPAVRFLLAIPIFYAVTYFGISRIWLILCFALGGIAIGAYAEYQHVILHIGRVGEYPIHFGGVGILTAFFCLTSFFFVPKETPFVRLIKLFLLFGIMGGFLASILSGSRGGWVFVIVAIPILAYGLGSRSSKIKRIFWCFVMVGAVSSVLLYVIPSTGVASRIHEAVQEVENYAPGEVSAVTSVGARLDTWYRTLILIEEKPLTGWGIKGYRERMQKFVTGAPEQKILILNHSHNDILNDTAKRGVFSLLVLLLGLYFFPLRYFFKNIQDSSTELAFPAILGTLFISAWIVFGLTNNFLERNQMIQYYLIYLTVLSGMIEKMELAKE